MTALCPSRPSRRQPVILPLKHRRYPSAMTLCIAAHTNTDLGLPRIVLCSDYLVGDDFSVHENTPKVHLPFLPGLCVMFAGRLEDVQDLIRLYKIRSMRTGYAINDTYEKLKEELWCGMQEFREWLARCGRKKGQTDAQLLVCGFLQGMPLIVSVDQSQVSRCEREFSAIGTGAYAAEIMLRIRFRSVESTWETRLRQALYFVYEAKRISEMSPSVGPMTSLIVLEPTNGGLRSYHAGFETLMFFHNQFDRFGPQPYSDGTTPPWPSVFPEAPQRLLSTKDDPSHQPPSPESPGETGEF